jgi:hypothetical protein
MGACWCARIKEAVLRFLSRQDKDLLDACFHLFGWIVEFRRASPMNPTRRLILCLEITGSDGILHTRDYLVSEKAL